MFRVERVECGLPADQADLKPGDYVVFINKTNVVMMAEDDVMELIKWVYLQQQLSYFVHNYAGVMVITQDKLGTILTYTMKANDPA